MKKLLPWILFNSYNVNSRYAHTQAMISYTLKGVTLQRSSLKLIPEDTLDRAVEILKAIANSVRLQIVNILLSGEFSVKQLVDKLGLLQSHTSIQLSILRWHGIVKSRRDGNKVYYSLANDSIKKIVKVIIAKIWQGLLRWWRWCWWNIRIGNEEQQLGY